MTTIINSSINPVADSLDYMARTLQAEAQGDTPHPLVAQLRKWNAVAMHDPERVPLVTLCQRFGCALVHIRKS
jgi:hypothetical protein